jgi:hypothetical protein
MTRGDLLRRDIERAGTTRLVETIDEAMKRGWDLSLEPVLLELIRGGHVSGAERAAALLLQHLEPSEHARILLSLHARLAEQRVISVERERLDELTKKLLDTPSVLDGLATHLQLAIELGELAHAALLLAANLRETRPQLVELCADALRRSPPKHTTELLRMIWRQTPHVLADATLRHALLTYGDPPISVEALDRIASERRDDLTTLMYMCSAVPTLFEAEPSRVSMLLEAHPRWPADVDPAPLLSAALHVPSRTSGQLTSPEQHAAILLLPEYGMREHTAPLHALIQSASGPLHPHRTLASSYQGILDSSASVSAARLSWPRAGRAARLRS